MRMGQRETPAETSLTCHPGTSTQVLASDQPVRAKANHLSQRALSSPPPLQASRRPPQHGLPLDSLAAASPGRGAGET